MKPVTFSPEELAIRRPLWVAMSDLFLDTDSRLSYVSIAERAAETPFSIGELENILREEVAPVVQNNLLSVAGEWAMFPEDWLVEQITTRLSSRWRMPYLLLSGVREDWRAIRLLVDRLRTIDRSQWPCRSKVWQAFQRLFLDHEVRLSEGSLAEVRACGFTLAQLDWMYRHEAWESFGLGLDAYRKHNPSTYPDRDGVERSWAELRLKLSDEVS